MLKPDWANAKYGKTDYSLRSILVLGLARNEIFLKKEKLSKI